MQIRRCSVLFLEAREELEFDLDSLLAGGAGLGGSVRWLGIAPHLENPVELTLLDLELLIQLSRTRWTSTEALADHLSQSLETLLESGLVIEDGTSHSRLRKRDQTVAKQHWWPASALFHNQARWKGIDGVQLMEGRDLLTAAGLTKRFGPPPPHVVERSRTGGRVDLPRATQNEFDTFLRLRATCRNYDVRPLDQESFALMMERVFSAQAQVDVGNASFLKKTSPSGGGLHATEAYLIVQNVEGVAPGLYHYHPVDHALEPLPGPDVPLADFAKLALAGQHWFSNAPVLVVLAPRFARSFWKYRYHAKAYRALILDSGHLSQTLYLSATDLGLGAFVTSAINEVDIEQAFGMDPLEESPLAICGFGWRAERMETAEFDPAGEVWEPAESPSGDPSL